MSSLEKVSPGIRPLFFNQNIAANEPEKKIPSTAAKATTLSPRRQKLVSLHEILYASDIFKLHTHTHFTYFYNNITTILPRNQINKLVQ